MTSVCQMAWSISVSYTHLLPDAAILVGCLMLGNLMKECGVVERIKKTAGNELMNIITIFLGFSVGCTTQMCIRDRPKRVALVRKDEHSKPWLFLVEAQKGRKPGIRWEEDVLTGNGVRYGR